MYIIILTSHYLHLLSLYFCWSLHLLNLASTVTSFNLVCLFGFGFGDPLSLIQVTYKSLVWGIFRNMGYFSVAMLMQENSLPQQRLTAHRASWAPSFSMMGHGGALSCANSTRVITAERTASGSNNAYRSQEKNQLCVSVFHVFTYFIHLFM